VLVLVWLAFGGWEVGNSVARMVVGDDNVWDGSSVLRGLVRRARQGQENKTQAGRACEFCRKRFLWWDEVPAIWISKSFMRVYWAEPQPQST
jgi:hypothetical protein